MSMWPPGTLCTKFIICASSGNPQRLIRRTHHYASDGMIESDLMGDHEAVIDTYVDG